MSKTILLTGATGGIGLDSARLRAAEGHTLLMHGRSQARLDAARDAVGGTPQGYVADRSDLDAVARLTDDIARDHVHLDVIINNAGVSKMPHPITKAALNAAFADAADKFFDKDAGAFDRPHPDTAITAKVAGVMQAVGAIAAGFLNA